MLTADGQTLTGDFVADSISSVTLTLQNGSSLEGSINADKTAKEARLTLDASSTWDLTADSYLTSSHADRRHLGQHSQQHHRERPHDLL